MKKILLSLFVLSSFNLFSQSQSLPIVNLSKLNGDVFSTADIDNDDKPIIISFWASWCKPCILELNTIADLYGDWQDETGVKLIAVTIDDTRNVQKVAPLVAASDWDYEVYLDVNSDFKRAMNVNAIPHTFLLDENKNIVWQHNSYSPGSEDELYEKVIELIN